MISPVNFGLNKQTVESNAFQNKDVKMDAKTSQSKAKKEFDKFVKLLRSKGIEVIEVADTKKPFTPDSIFPNNWISFHQDGTIGLYPMMAKNRRLERRQDLIEQLHESHQISKVVDMTKFEFHGKFLEGTGSLVLDRVNKIAYACISPRTDKLVLEVFAKHLGYKKVIPFHSVDKEGQQIYHTNVMMCIADKIAILCEDSIPHSKELEKVKKNLTETGHKIISISYKQMNKFAGNMLQVQNADGKKYLIMSKSALGSLDPKQIKQIEKHCEILSSPIPTIENLGGGSVRCMMAEVFLPKK